MRRINKTNNVSEFGPWNVVMDGPLVAKTIEPLTTNEYPFPQKTYRTIKLPRIAACGDTRMSQKLTLQLSKHSLEVPTQIRSRVTGMSGSLVGKGKQSKNRKISSFSVDLGPRELQRKISTVQLNQLAEGPFQTTKKTVGHSLNMQSARKRCLKHVINEVKAHSDLLSVFLWNKKQGRYS